MIKYICMLQVPSINGTIMQFSLCFSTVSVIWTLCQFFNSSHVNVQIYASQIVPYALLYLYKYFGIFPIFFE
jgi:hypothetical protein